MTERADVLVVGAGPAGSTAALRLSRAGRAVVLVDGARFPRAKVCGDGLTPRAIAALQHLGVWAEVSRSATRVSELQTVDLLAGTTHRALLPSRVRGGPGFGAVVSRGVLDDVIRRAAVDAGVRFVPATRVRAVEVGRRGRAVTASAFAAGGPRVIEADVVIAADGANSRMAEMLFGERPGVIRGVAVRQYWRVPSAPAFTVCVPLKDGVQELAGYGWVFPVGTAGANVGVGSMGSAPCSVRALYARFVHQLRAIFESWRFAEPIGPLEGGALAAGLRLDRVVSGRVLFAGDAAGAVNAFTGEGIAQAIEGGWTASEAIVSTSDRPSELRDAYWAGLADRFPHSTRNVESLPWLIERGGTFGRDFWDAASGQTRLLGRAARRMTLDEGLDEAQGRFASPPARAAWAMLQGRLHGRRPLLAQLLDALATEVSGSIDALFEAYCGKADAHEPRCENVDVALVCIALVTVLARDPSAAPVRFGSRRASWRSSWPTDSAALAMVDLIVAELMQILARLPQRWAVSVSAALSALVASDSRDVLAGRPLPPVTDELAEFARSLGWGATNAKVRAV